MPTTLNQLWTVATSGIFSRQRQLDVISHNVANVNTVGFRASEAGFHELVQDRVVEEEEAGIFADAQPGDVIQDWMGTYYSHTLRALDQGELQATGDPYHLAVNGDGFFQLSGPDGSMVYTRDGDFRRDAAGQLVNHAGYRLAPPVTIPADYIQVYIDPQGRIMGQTEDTDVLPVQVGTVQLATFRNPDGLESMGGNLLAATEASGQAELAQAGAQGRGTVLSGYLESSNVDLEREMVNLMRVRRNHALNLRALRIADEMYRLANEIQRP